MCARPWLQSLRCLHVILLLKVTTRYVTLFTKRMSHTFTHPIQSSKLLLVLISTIILGFGPRRDSWPYFCSFRVRIALRLAVYTASPVLVTWSRDAPHRLQRLEQFFYCCMFIRYLEMAHLFDDVRVCSLYLCPATDDISF
jgi:hypothetical protein